MTTEGDTSTSIKMLEERKARIDSNIWYDARSPFEYLVSYLLIPLRIVWLAPFTASYFGIYLWIRLVLKKIYPDVRMVDMYCLKWFGFVCTFVDEQFSVIIRKFSGLIFE